MRKYSADLSLSMGRWLRDRNKILTRSRSFASICGGYFIFCQTYLFSLPGYWFVPAAAAIIIHALNSYACNSCKTVNDNKKLCRRIKRNFKYLYNVLNVPIFSNLNLEYTLELSVRNGKWSTVAIQRMEMASSSGRNVHSSDIFILKNKCNVIKV
jgi:hypothetical protein